MKHDQLNDEQMQMPRLTLNVGNTHYILWTFMGLTLLLSMWGIVVRGAAIEWLLAVMCVVTIIISYVFPRLAFRHITIERIQLTHAVDSEEVIVGLSLQSKWRMPGVWYATIEQLSNQSEVDSEPIRLLQHYEPFFNRSMQQYYSLKHLSRGQYKSDYVTVVVGDLLGLTTFKKTIILPLSFIVMPHLLPEHDQTFLSQLTSQKWSTSMQNSSQQELKGNADVQLIESTQLNGGLKPYSVGDSIHRIYYHAISRGMGVHVFDDEQILSQIKQVIFIDQFVPPMAAKMVKQQFNTLIGWVLDKTANQLTQGNGPVMVVTDNWCYECYELYQLEELRRLLAQLKPDVQYPISDRLISLAKILPSHCSLSVYTTDWKNSEGWTELAQLAWHKKATVRLQLLSEQRIMTYTMREQQRELEQNGLQLTWRFSNYAENRVEFARKGSESYGYN